VEERQSLAAPIADSQKSDMGKRRRDRTHQQTFHSQVPSNSEIEDSANLPDPDIIAAEIVEDLQAALAQLKFARCPHSLTASLAALPSMSLIPFAPFAEIASELKR